MDRGSSLRAGTLWRAVPEDQEPQLVAAAQDVVNRALRGPVLFSSSDTRVDICTPDDRDRPYFNWPIQISLPGYSPDGRLAIMFLQLPWSIHFVDATYVLDIGGSTPTVVVREFIYHP